MDNIVNTAEKIIKIINVSEINKVVISNPILKNDEISHKVIVKKIILKDEECFQFSFYIGKKVIHQNSFEKDIKLIDKILNIMSDNFKQCNIEANNNVTILMNRKKQFKLTGITENNNNQNCILNHDNEKNYIIKQGQYIDWMYKLNMMSKNGYILKNMQKKYRQINKFLEMISDIEKYIPNNAVIVDMGCGKSYLTFALYYYFNVIKNKNVIIKGFDLKKDVVDKCNELINEFNFKNIEFQAGDIAQLNNSDIKVDMVITLHACDTATDYAIYNAVNWGCKVIMCVPCCQHEVFGQIKNEYMNIILKHGILKERFSAIFTDAIRANMLELNGYKTNVIEFIDMEHTPKNIMIRAIKKRENNNTDENNKYNDFVELMNDFNLEPSIYKLLK